MLSGGLIMSAFDIKLPQHLQPPFTITNRDFALWLGGERYVKQQNSTAEREEKRKKKVKRS